MSDIEKSNKTGWMEAFANLRPDLFFPDTWNEAEKDAALEEIRPTKMRTTLFSSIPMTCMDKDCPVANTCPLFKINQAPKGKACPLEMALVQDFMQEYMKQLNIDPEDLTEVSLVRDLVDQEVQSLRRTKVMANEHFIQDFIVSVNEKTGEPIWDKRLHQAVEYEDKIHKRKKEIRNQLLATREARAKIGQGQVDTSRAIADMFDALAKLDRERDEFIKRKQGIYGVDEYIEADVLEDKELNPPDTE